MKPAVLVVSPVRMKSRRLLDLHEGVLKITVILILPTVKLQLLLTSHTVLADVKGQPLFLLTVMVQKALPTGREVEAGY